MTGDGPVQGLEGRSYEELLESITHVLRDIGRVVVCVSGGLDSMTLLEVARDVLGTGCAVGVMADTESIPGEDRAMVLDAFPDVHIMSYSEVGNDAYRKNDRHRCYHCKGMLFQEAKEVAHRLSVQVDGVDGSQGDGRSTFQGDGRSPFPGDGRSPFQVVDGANADDTGDYRPGLKAASERGIRHPWMEAGCTKEDIRVIARHRGLPWSERTGSPCLSSRIPYGTEVTHERLEQVGNLETALRGMGFDPVRVRHHGSLAKIEVPDDRIEELVALRKDVDRAARETGFLYVSIDLGGFESGRLNRMISF